MMCPCSKREAIQFRSGWKRRSWLVVTPLWMHLQALPTPWHASVLRSLYLILEYASTRHCLCSRYLNVWGFCTLAVPMRESQLQVMLRTASTIPSSLELPLWRTYLQSILLPQHSSFTAAATRIVFIACHSTRLNGFSSFKLPSLQNIFGTFL